jgi:hypothetical protein
MLDVVKSRPSGYPGAGAVVSIQRLNAPVAAGSFTGRTARGRVVGYELAPMTLKSALTKMWWGQLTPMLWTS